MQTKIGKLPGLLYFVFKKEDGTLVYSSGCGYKGADFAWEDLAPVVSTHALQVIYAAVMIAAFSHIFVQVLCRADAYAAKSIPIRMERLLKEGLGRFEAFQTACH